MLFDFIPQRKIMYMWFLFLIILQSAVFTGVHSYVIAGAWLLCGLGFGIFVTWKNLLRSDSSQVEEYLNHHFLLLFLLIILFTSLAM